MIKLKRGMIVDVVLDPVRGSETGKTRPCIVVTNDRYNARVPIVQVTPITNWSEKKSKIVTNVVLEKGGGTGLTKRSIADCLQTRPIDRRHRIRKKRGKLSDADLAKISAALIIVFELEHDSDSES